jgi:hypothetical protein
MSSPTPTPAGATLTSKLLALGGVIVSCAYLANLGAGVFAEIPDLAPAVGNLDEVFFSGLLIVCLHKLGIQVIPGLRSAAPGAPKAIDGPR